MPTAKYFSGTITAIFAAAFFAFPCLAWAASPISDAEPFAPIADEFASAVVMVPKTHQVLFAFKPDQPRVPASLTKLTNALAFSSLKPNWDKVISLQKADEVGGGRLRVAPGAKISVQDALFSAITASANNTAAALARISGLSQKAYLAKMNAEAKRAGAKHSAFLDAAGMNEKNRTTARDMALIAEAAFAQPMIQKAASTATYRFTIRNTGVEKTITNTNYLLTRDPSTWVIGGKTGYLEESHYNFVTQLRALDETGNPVYGKDLLVVVMGAPTKEGSFWSAKRMAQWAWKNYAF